MIETTNLTNSRKTHLSLTRVYVLSLNAIVINCNLTEQWRVDLQIKLKQTFYTFLQALHPIVANSMVTLPYSAK